MKRGFGSWKVMAAALSVAGLGPLLVIGWSARGAERTVSQHPSLPLGMSINQVMVAVVDDAAHIIWEGGNTDKPLTKGQWQNIELHTYQLQAAATLVSMGGTGKSDADWTASPGFQKNLIKLRDMAIATRHAVDTKDQKALRADGDALVTVCEGCHKQYKPSAPTEGIYHKPYYDECSNTFVPE